MSEQEIILTRTIRAPRSRVYDAFTTAEGWCAWCCETAEIEARDGGSLHIYTEGYNAYGSFQRVRTDRVVIFTWNGDGEPPTVVFVMLDDQKDGTSLEFRVTGWGSQGLVFDLGEFAGFLQRIWGRALDNLKAVLEAETGADQTPQ